MIKVLDATATLLAVPGVDEHIAAADVAVEHVTHLSIPDPS